MTSPSPRTTAITDLTHLVVSWPELRDALTARSATWPPVMGLHLERDDDQAGADAAEYAERTAVAPGERPAPLSVSVLDTITAIQDELLALADEIAGAIQRPAFTVRSASPDDRIARDIALMALKDSQDRRRWRYNHANRTGDTAACWLADRLTDPRGPFRAITDEQVHRIAQVATGCRRRAAPLLASPTATDGRPVDLPQACGCGGQLSLVNEKKASDWRITCAGCGTSWSGAALLAYINAA